MIILLIGVDEREGSNANLQYLVYIRWVGISFLKGFIDNECKSKTMEKTKLYPTQLSSNLPSRNIQSQGGSLSQFSFFKATTEKSHLDSVQV